MREKKNTAVLLWVHYERVSHFQFWSWVSEVYEKSAWATHVSSLRPDIQSALTNVRPTKLNTNARDIRGPTDRWVLKGYLWADYERIMRGLWEDYESRASRCFRFEVYGKSSWATHFSSLRPDRQSVLTNVRPTKLDKNPGDIRGPTDRWVLKGYLWADYERIMRRSWETEGHTVNRRSCLASSKNQSNKNIVCPPLASLI